jgi:RNA polymerase sigma-70 factor, ECF subfamily
MVVPKEICDRYSEMEIIQKALVEVDFFSCLYERYEARLMRYIKRLTHVTHMEAEDILQESFINIWKNLHAFDQSLKLSSWIYRIVHNQAVSGLRKKLSYGKDEAVEWNETLNADIPDETPDSGMEELPNLDQSTHSLLEQLPLPYKEVLVLKFLENMSYEEISDVLKLPEGTVATRINRAKKAFKHLAQDQHVIFERY